MPKPESAEFPSWPPPAEKSIQEQPFCAGQQHARDLRVQVDLTSGKFFPDTDMEGMARRATGAVLPFWQSLQHARLVCPWTASSVLSWL